MPAELDRTLAALAEPTRRAIVGVLREQPLRASDIADRLCTSRPAMSRHLRVLRRAGVVRETPLERDARVRVYRLERQPFADLRAWIDEVEAFWGDQLAAFKAHVEAQHGPTRSRGRR